MEVNKILFPADFSETAQNAFRYCLVLADKLKANIDLVHVIYPEYDAMDVPIFSTKATKDRIEAAKVALQSFAGLGLKQVHLRHQFHHIPEINFAIEIGNPASVIANLARRDEIELIVMGTKGEHNLFEKALGSVTTGVIRKSQSHIWIVPEKAALESIDTVACGTNLLEADPYHIWKLDKLLEPFNPILHCVHVDTKGEIDSVLDLKEMSRFFDDHSPTLQINFHNISGKSVSESLEEFNANHEVDLLVMFSHHHDLIERLFHRSQTKKMALKTRIPMLVIGKK